MSSLTGMQTQSVVTSTDRELDDSLDNIEYVLPLDQKLNDSDPNPLGSTDKRFISIPDLIS